MPVGRPEPERVPVGQLGKRVARGVGGERVGEGLVGGEAREVLAHFAPEAVYCRADMVMRGDTPLLMELELIEPEMMLEWAPESASALAWAILDAPAWPRSGLGGRPVPGGPIPR